MVAVFAITLLPVFIISHLNGRCCQIVKKRSSNFIIRTSSLHINAVTSQMQKRTVIYGNMLCMSHDNSSSFGHRFAFACSILSHYVVLRIRISSIRTRTQPSSISQLQTIQTDIAHRVLLSSFYSYQRFQNRENTCCFFQIFPNIRLIKKYISPFSHSTRLVKIPLTFFIQ